MTKIINIKTSSKKDFVYIGRGTTFGNPNDIMGSNRKSAIEAYRYDFYQKIKRDKVFKLEVLRLYGKTLGCSCKPLDCHGDVIVDYLNSIDDIEKEIFKTESFLKKYKSLQE